jgi:hypothetical protein
VSDHHACPDGGTCHHHCVEGCFRVECCSPLSGVYPDDEWPADIRTRHAYVAPAETSHSATCFADPGSPCAVCGYGTAKQAIAPVEPMTMTAEEEAARSAHCLNSESLVLLATIDALRAAIAGLVKMAADPLRDEAIVRSTIEWLREGFDTEDEIALVVSDVLSRGDILARISATIAARAALVKS